MDPDALVSLQTVIFGNVLAALTAELFYLQQTGLNVSIVSSTNTLQNITVCKLTKTSGSIFKTLYFLHTYE